MRNKFRLFTRANGVWYVEDSDTGKQSSLKTKDKAEAVRLCNARNEAVKQPALNLALGKAYLAAHDPNLVTRTWEIVFSLWATIGKKESTITRKVKAAKCRAFDLIRAKVVTQTTSDDLLAVLKAGGTSVNKFLRDIHNLAINNGWLSWPIIAPSAWPEFTTKPRRGVTAAEHTRLLAVEPMPEWRDYYCFLWLVGCSQTDGATICAEHINWESKTLAYQRTKLGTSSEPASMSIGPTLEALLKRLPSAGYLFPGLAVMTEKSRATHFKKRTDKAGIVGVTLHSYRYAWAERGASAGYPERWAKAALGHASSAVHRHYSKQARVVCPSLEEYESKIIPLRKAV